MSRANVLSPKLPVRARLFIKRTPWLYRLAKRLRNRHAKSLLCSRTTDLCIEGYESSGNSFSFAILRHANNTLRIAHHCHSVANLKLALKYGVPAVCLIRHPSNAISSRLVRFGGDLEGAVREYVGFYDFVLRHVDRLVILTFEEVTQDTRGFLERITRETGLTLSLDSVEELEERAMRAIRETSAKRGVPERVSLPLESRERKKAQLQQKIRYCRYYPDAVAIWQQVTQRAKL